MTESDFLRKILSLPERQKICKKLDFKMPPLEDYNYIPGRHKYPDRKKLYSNARSYLLHFLLPKNELIAVHNQLYTEEINNKNKHSRKKILERKFIFEFVKIGSLLNSKLPYWSKYLIDKKIPVSELKEMLFFIKNKWILDMSTPFWTRLTPSQQKEYAKFYQQGYAKQINKKTRDNFYYEQVKFEMALIPPGKFIMGRPFAIHHDGPQQKVALPEYFWLSTTETTQKQWFGVVSKRSNDFAITKPWKLRKQFRKLIPPNNKLVPVTYVSYNDIQENFFMNNINYKLPSEIEWEYACKAGTTSLGFWGREDPGQYMWYCDNAFNRRSVKNFIKEVKNKKSNSWGIYGMGGNVAEFCSNDFFSFKAINNSTNKKLALNKTQFNTYRGGAITASIYECYSSNRDEFDQNKFYSIAGFRIILK